MSISIGAGYSLPEEEDRADDPNSSERTAVVDDLNAKLQVRPLYMCSWKFFGGRARVLL